ncbi:putative monovalent cation/H+ antiporter subunit F [Andreesenia angusta]|uniref:Putative monovalent cation/H+ antiporter subunit F n=1 Tax=Andreesenia angusta TaxID=39480 RepID=A0A1S1VBP1_9FIRM|nr:putative monovalent cation/H+ antiporter subunit F [Andreesenia angusta]
MLELFLILVSVLILFLAIYVIKHHNIWDSILGMSLSATLIVLGIVLYAAFTDSTMFIDIAITFGLLGFVGTLFTAVFIYTRGDI